MSKESYTLVDKNGRAEIFSNAREAGAAFRKASSAEKPTVIKSVEGRKAGFLASTLERKNKTTGEPIYKKYMSSSDKKFREGWKQNLKSYR